jgi:hypothetical protein
MKCITSTISRWASIRESRIRDLVIAARTRVGGGVDHVAGTCQDHHAQCDRAELHRIRGLGGVSGIAWDFIVR